MADMANPMRAPRRFRNLFRPFFIACWQRAEGYQKILLATGLILLVSGLVHLVVLTATGGSLEGDVSFRKAITFGEAFGLTAISLAWFLAYVPKRRALWWGLAAVYAAATLIEVAMVTMQVWRGVPSHFNTATPFDNAVFAVMGISISLHVPLILAVTIAVFIAPAAPVELKWAMRAALLSFIFSLFIGGVMIANGSNTLGAAGQAKLPHALGLHALQLLPGLAYLLEFTGWPPALKSRLNRICIAGYLGIVAVSGGQALRGVALFDMRSGGVVVFVAAALAVAVPLLCTGYRLWWHNLLRT